MKTPIAALTMTALLLVAGGCQSGHGTSLAILADETVAETASANFGAFGFTPIGIDNSSADEKNVARPSGAFTATKSIVAEERTFTLSQAHQVFEISDSQATPVLAAKAILGSVSFKIGASSIDRDFNGQLGTSDNGSGNPNNPDATVNSGWAYIQLDPGYSNSSATGYRPIVRTKRVIAMSQGTSMLIFNDPLSNPSEEFIINRANSGGNISVKLNGNATPVILAPGQYTRVEGLPGLPSADAPSLLSDVPANSKLKKFLNYARRARAVAFNTDTGE
jgi:hypothetical protein